MTLQGKVARYSAFWSPQVKKVEFGSDGTVVTDAVHTRNQTLFEQQKEAIGQNGPFAADGHMVQNPPCWRASYALGHPKQSDFIQLNLNFLCFACPSA